MTTNTQPVPHRRRYDTIEKVAIYLICAVISSFLGFGVKLTNDNIREIKVLQSGLTAYHFQVKELKDSVSRLSVKQDQMLKSLHKLELKIARLKK